MIGKAYRGALHHPDDVFDLPEAMSTHMVAGRVSKQAEQMAKLVPVVSSSNEQLLPDEQPHISLVRLLYNCWGKEFFAIGLLKLLNDCAGFAGPLLLHAVVDFMETPGQPAMQGYLYALLLALSRCFSCSLQDISHNTKTMSDHFIHFQPCCCSCKLPCEGWLKDGDCTSE